jgi:hypothetical protein
MRLKMATSTHVISEKKQAADTATETAATMDSAVGAAFVAAGVGSLVLGLALLGAEVSPGIKSFLNWVGPVGPLSGKVGLTVIAFIVSWVGLHFAFRTRAVKLANSFAISLVLIVIGFLLTFPPVFQFLTKLLTGK